MTANNDLEEMTFEQALGALEETVAKLEGGSLPLQETLTLFERGQSLVAHCNTLLNGAELRLQQLRSTDDGSLVTEDINEDDA